MKLTLRTICLLAVWIIPATHAKLQGGYVRLNGLMHHTQWGYISKFGYNIGNGRFQIRMRPNNPQTLLHDVKLVVSVYLDEEWPTVEKLAGSQTCDKLTHARLVKDISINATGDWGDWTDGSLSQSTRPHIWFFAISDCDHQLENFSHKLEFEFHATQEDGSEFSVEMQWMLTANMVFLVGFTILLTCFWKGSERFIRSAGSVHPVIWILCVGMVVQYMAQLFHTLHLRCYKYDGDGLKFLEILSEILFMLSQMSQSSLLILIALGYTLLQSKLGELDLMIPMCLLIAFIHMMLVGLGKLEDDAPYRFHKNEGPIGWTLLFMRLGLYAWFYWAAGSSARESGTKIRSFLYRFRVGGSLYFLAFPCIFLVTKCFAPYLQHGIMTIGLLVMQMGSNVWLTALFLTRGDYYNLSTLSSSALPGGTKVGTVKEE